MLKDYDLSQVKGITSKKLERLELMGLANVQELIDYYPYRYENYELVDLKLAQQGEKVTVEGELHGTPYLRYLGSKRNMLTAQMIVDNRMINLVWFNRGFLKKQLTAGRFILVTGKWDKGRDQITVAESSFPDTATIAKKGNIMPIYSVPADFYLTDLQKIMRNALDQYAGEIVEYLPAEIIESYRLPLLADAVRAIHFPADENDHQQARRRLIYDELLQYQLRLQIHKKKIKDSYRGAGKTFDTSKIQDLIDSLPYRLTADQETVIADIYRDLASSEAMNRLLQGDVGSGKTVVAIIALYAAYLAGFQGAFMVPTEILANQHLESLDKLLGPLGVKVSLLTSSVPTSEQAEIINKLASGETDIVVGTHSLFQERVNYQRLGLVVVDEQHRFGVEQRAELRRKGTNGAPDVLYMSATPIPRTLAITAYGEMDVSSIKELPAGRKRVKTSLIRTSKFSEALAFTEQEIAKGKQAYIICPLIEESEKLDVQNATELAVAVQEALPAYRVGLMHGRLPTEEKDQVIEDFRLNQLQVLVSTTVIEVGVNISNVTVMIIYDADRFGLAQLHQLRGRVGRGDDQSYCILVADPTTDIGKERLQVMLDTDDGFEIAARDLELRGAGDLLGVRQSGLPDFKLADIVRDYRTLETALRDATLWVNDGRLFTDSEYGRVLAYLKELDTDLISS